MGRLKFVFYWCNEKGKSKTFFSRRGSLDKDILILHKTEIPITSIVEVAIQDTLLVIHVIGDDEQITEIPILSGKAGKIRAELGRILSANRAENQRKELIKKGDADSFRVELCPVCGSTINLSHFPETPQFCCIFCGTLSSFEANLFAEKDVAKPEKGYRLCEVCGMFTKSRHFTIFYLIYNWFYFSYSWRCPPCMRKDAWKMLFVNLITIMVVPMALVQIFRSYGGTSFGGKYAGLDRANLLARKGQLEKAVETYRQILQKHPTAAGIKYNLGLTFLTENRFEEAAQAFEYALQDCSNYPPAAESLALCYEEIGETEKLDELKRVWSIDDEKEYVEDGEET